MKGRIEEYYDKLNNSKKDKYSMLSLICGTKTKIKQNRNRLTDIENKLVVIRVEKEGGEAN